MATAYETAGPCVPQVGTGAADALEVLGVAEDGAEVAIDYEIEGIRTDAGGRKPAELQWMGSEAFIDFRLPVKDAAVLAKVIQRSEASATLGQGGTPGALLGTGAHLFKLYLPSSTGTVWYFPTCRLVTKGGKYGTEKTSDRLRFHAIRFLPGTAVTAAGVVLFTNAAPS